MQVGYSRKFGSPEMPTTGLLLWLEFTAPLLNTTAGEPGTPYAEDATDVHEFHERSSFATEMQRDSNPGPTYKWGIINGHEVLRYTPGGFNGATVALGAGNLARLDALTGTNGGTIYLVGRVRDTFPPAATHGLFNISERDPGFSFWSQGYHTDGHLYDCNLTNAMKDCGSLDLTSDFMLGIFSKTNQYTCRLNGAQVFNTGTNTFRAPNGAITPMLGGATTGGGRIMGALDAAEWIIYDHVLDAGEIAALEAYLADKYGL
jgi:hypothetical protein